MNGLVWRIQDGFIHMSVGMAGKLGSAETVHWSTGHDGQRVDFLNGGSGLKKQCSHEQGGNCLAF